MALEDAQTEIGLLVVGMTATYCVYLEFLTLK